MNDQALRRLYLQMDEIVDAMDSQGDSTRFFLDVETGEVSLSIDALPADERHVEIPRRGAAPDYHGLAETARRERLVTEAITWLAGLGIEPQFELRPTTPSRPFGRPESDEGEEEIGLYDLLLLGAPGGKTELIRGRVLRRFVAADPGQARRVFARVARQLAEQHGLAWRRSLVEGSDRFELSRCVLEVAGRQVELTIEMPPTVWDAFTG